MPMMRGAADILSRLYADLETIGELVQDVQKHDNQASGVARIDAIRVELYLKKNADPIRDIQDTLTQIKRLIEEELRPKLQRRAQLDQAEEDAIERRVAALEAWKADVERGSVRALPYRKEG